MSKAAVLLSLGFAGVLFAGCAGGPSEIYMENMVAGKHFFENGRFDQARANYQSALDEKPNDYEALLGLANASSEYSIGLYIRGSDLIGTRSPEAGVKQIEDADKAASFANRIFARAIELQSRNGDEAHSASYGYGLFLYKRATSPVNFPYPMKEEAPRGAGPEDRAKWEAGYRQRLHERDLSIQQFEIVIADEPKDLASPEHVRGCKSPWAHRYLGLALFSRADWDRRDGERARKHMTAHLSYLIKSRELVLQDPRIEKQAKQKRIMECDTAIIDIKDLIRERLNELKQYEAQIQAGKEVPTISADELSRRMAAVAVEIEAVSELVSQFEKASGAPKEQGKP